MSEIYGEYLRLLRVRDKDAKISGGHPARGVWSGLGKESPDVTRTNIWNAQIFNCHFSNSTVWIDLHKVI